MKSEAEKNISEMFCDSHNISCLESTLKEVVANTYAPFLLFSECLQTPQFQSRKKPLDGFLINMIHRASNTFGGMVTLISTGHLQDSEINARTLGESTLMIQYLMNGNVTDNLANYLACYYSGQKWRNDKWQSEDERSNNYNHEQLILEKNQTNEQVRSICQKYIELAGGTWPKKPKATSIEKIYKKLEREIEYRTVYRAMCGQSHQNPEDLINNFISSFSDDQAIERKMLAEKHCFSIFICLWATRYFIEALKALGTYYEFESVVQQSKVSLDKIMDRHYEINQSLVSCKFPSGWVKSIVHGI